MVFRPLKAHPCTELHCLAYYASKSVQAYWLGARGRTPQKSSGVNFGSDGCAIAHAQKRNPRNDLYKILHGGRYPQYNHLYKFWWPSVKGFLDGGVSNFPLPILLISTFTTCHICWCAIISPFWYLLLQLCDVATVDLTRCFKVLSFFTIITGDIHRTICLCQSSEVWWMYISI